MTTSTNYNSYCFKCGKPFICVGDVAEGGFPMGSEPWCTCGTKICKKCGQRFIPKECEHEEV